MQQGRPNRPINGRPPVDQRGLANAERLNARRAYDRLRRINLRHKSGIEKIEQLSHLDLLLSELGADQSILQAHRGKRRSTKRAVVFENASFFDDPNAALDKLAEIAKADRAGAPYRIDFTDRRCLDLAPYLVFSLMRKVMRHRICRGGSLTDHVTKIMRAVQLDSFAKMLIINQSEDSHSDIWPIEIDSVFVPSAKQNSVGIAVRKQQNTATRITRELNRWLQSAGFQLTNDASGRVITLLGELLDNSRHAQTHRASYGWTVAGCMIPDREAIQFDCHIAIVTLGRSFAEALRGADDLEIRKMVLDYAKRHRDASPQTDESALITALALQDSITSDGKGGCGMSKLVELINELGTSHPPELVIVSGDSCVRVAQPYHCMSTLKTDAGSQKRQFFNTDQSSQMAPSPNHVFRLTRKFPGTVISMRFKIDKEGLTSRISGNSGGSTPPPETE
jgi:hypothetical protein